MIKQYVLTQTEVDNVQRRLWELRHLALLSRDGGHLEEALKILGLRKEENRPDGKDEC